MSLEERQSALHEVALKSSTRILQVPNSEVDHETTAQSPHVLVGTAGKLLAVEGKSFRSTDVYLFDSDCIVSKQFLLLVTKWSPTSGLEVVPVVSVDAVDGPIKVLGLAVCTLKKTTMYRGKYMPLCEIEEGTQLEGQEDNEVLGGTSGS